MDYAREDVEALEAFLAGRLPEGAPAGPEESPGAERMLLERGGVFDALARALGPPGAAKAERMRRDYAAGQARSLWQLYFAALRERVRRRAAAAPRQGAKAGVPGVPGVPGAPGVESDRRRAVRSLGRFLGRPPAFEDALESLDLLESPGAPPGGGAVPELELERVRAVVEADLRALCAELWPPRPPAPASAPARRQTGRRRRK